MKKTDFDQDLINTLRSLKTNGDVNPSVFFRENTKIRLMNLISEEKVLENKSSFVFIKNPKFAFRLAGAFLIILVFISTGTILAAQSVNPKNSLYPVKLASEDIALKLSPSSFKANVAVEIAKRRGDEIASQQKTNSKSEIKHGIEKYKESINQAKNFVPSSDNTHLNRELKDEEDNLNQLTRRYEDSGEKVKGASDSNINSSGQNLEQQRSGIKLPVREQTNNQEIIREETKTQGSPSGSFDKTIQDIRDNVEKSVQDLTATPSPEEHE